MKFKRKHINFIFIIAFAIFVTVSVLTDYESGKEIGKNSWKFLIEMLKLLPCAFILIGLFEVWVKRETVEKHLGKSSNFMGFVWSIILASTTIGGLYVAFPVAYTLHNKGAKLSIIFTYVGAVAVCRIPMTVFEASFMGWKFTAIRLAVALPLVILTSIIIGRFLESRKYQILEPK